MYLKRRTVFLSILLIQPIEGNTRVFTVTCNDHSTGSGEVFSGSGSGLNSPSQEYCVNGNCSYSFDYLSEDLTKDSGINITCKMKLSSVITIVGLKNITVTGYNNAAVDLQQFWRITLSVLH